MSKLLQTLSVLESNQLLDELYASGKTNHALTLGLRNYTIALLMLDAGLRVGEVCKLLRTDLVFNGEPQTTVTLHADITKRAHKRTIPLSQRIRRAIENMQTHWWAKLGNYSTIYAFHNTQESGSITPRQIQRIICRAATSSIGRSIHPHVLRHTFATRLMRTTSIRIVQELLGHKNLSSTQIYTHPNNLDLKNAIDNLENTGD